MTERKTHKTFTLGEVLSITTGKLLCDMDGVYEILNHLTGDNLYTHQLPRASRHCKPFILAQLPDLSSETMAGVTVDNWKARLDAAIKKYGNEFTLDATACSAAWVSRNPLSEMVEIMAEKDTDNE